MTDVTILLTIVAVILAAAAWLRRLDGSVRAAGGERFARERLGLLGDVTALVQFTAPGCVPCDRVHEVLTAVASERAGVVVVKADVGEHLTLAREHGVLRAPTTLVVDRDGRVRHRISGVPSREAVESLLGGADRRTAA